MSLNKNFNEIYNKEEPELKYTTGELLLKGQTTNKTFLPVAGILILFGIIALIGFYMYGAELFAYTPKTEPPTGDEHKTIGLYASVLVGVLAAGHVLVLWKFAYSMPFDFNPIMYLCLIAAVVFLIIFFLSYSHSPIVCLWTLLAVGLVASLVIIWMAWNAKKQDYRYTEMPGYDGGIYTFVGIIGLLLLLTVVAGGFLLYPYLSTGTFTATTTL